MEVIMRALTDVEIQFVSGAANGDGIQVSHVLAVGASVTAVAAASLAIVPSPITTPAAIMTGVTSAVFAAASAGAAMLEAGSTGR
jgi:hypothetical protein